MKITAPTCPKCTGRDFELRFLRDEAVGAARCLKCSADYLLLDSKDYWFDVIQKGYPRLVRCACKSQSFQLRIDYSVRDDGDINYIEVRSICSACGKTRRQLGFKVDYGGTDHLFTTPLVSCKNPKILYDLKKLNLLLTLPAINRIVDYLANTAKCRFASCLRIDDNWSISEQDGSDVKETIEKRKYLFVYAMADRLDLPENLVNSIKREDAFWKQSEIIRISSKDHVCTYQLGEDPPRVCYCSDFQADGMYKEVGLSFYIDFSTEFARGEKIISKSEEFRATASGLLAMLQKEFVTWRGPHCFDDPDVNIAIFGDRFHKKARNK